VDLQHLCRPVSQYQASALHFLRRKQREKQRDEKKDGVVAVASHESMIPEICSPLQLLTGDC
jgi:hypothetical protein